MYFLSMRIFATRCLIVLVILAAPSFAFANPFKSKITETSSPLVITVPNDHFLKITNFSQQGGTDRGVVSVTLTGDENSGTANVLTATRVDLSTGMNAQIAPEVINRAIIAGPAQVTVVPVTGATLFITYSKESNEGGGGGGSNIVSVSPTPGATATPNIFFSSGATATATATPMAPTATPTPTATTATATPTAPTATPTPTATATPTAIIRGARQLGKLDGAPPWWHDIQP
jgi:hypothetical protein